QDPSSEEEMTLLRLGVIGSSAKENEHRLPLHPDHIPNLDADLRAQITLEHGYGDRFGVADEALAQHVAGFASRDEIPEASDVAAVGSPIHSVVIRQFEHGPDGVEPSHVVTERGREPLPVYLSQADIVVNCTLQDPNDPQIYLHTEDLDAFRPGSVIVDVSCD